MKKHLVLLTGIYYPKASPTGLCAHRYIQLLKDEYDLDVVFFQSDEHDVENVEYDGFHIHGILGKRMRAERKAKGFMKKMLHVIGRVEMLTRSLGNTGWYRKQALQKLMEIDYKRKIDVIFSTCSPFEAHLAAEDFKKYHPEVRHVAYTVDVYSSKNRVRPFYISYRDLKKRERSLFSSVDVMLLSDEIYDARPDLHQGIAHCSKLPYMLPNAEMNVHENISSKENINCVYAGRFYKDIRNPEYLFRIFAEIKDSRIKLHLFSVGCEDIVADYAAKNHNIILHEQVMPSEISQVYHDADILISLGNSLSEFKPSKTFEYIVTGKPIANIYYKDYVDDVLSKYPLSSQISNQSPLSEGARQLESFILENKEKKVVLKDIEKLYERHSVAYIKRVLNRAINN